MGEIENKFEEIQKSLESLETKNLSMNKKVIKGKKVATFGTFDLLHVGHKKIIEHTIEIADGIQENVYIGVASDSYNRLKGKISIQDELERVENLKKKYPLVNVFIENVKDFKNISLTWKKYFDEYDIDYVVMGGDHIGNLDFVDEIKKENGELMNILYFERTPIISSSLIRDEIKMNKIREMEKRLENFKSKIVFPKESIIPFPKLITYGTFDVFHIGHKKLIENMIELSGGIEDNVYVAVSSDEWVKLKGKKIIQNLDERIKKISKFFPNVNIIIEEKIENHLEYWGGDFDKHSIDYIVMGVDQMNNFKYLEGSQTKHNKIIRFIFLERTPEISSTLIRNIIKDEI